MFELRSIIQSCALFSVQVSGVSKQMTEVREQRTDVSDCNSRSIIYLLFSALCLLSSDI
jgi:hypothetical protein